MKTSVINSVLIVVFVLNAFGCVYNETVQGLQEQAMVNSVDNDTH